MPLRISTTLNDTFSQIIKDLEGIGYTAPEMIKAGIRALHRKEFPPYGRKGMKGKDNMTEEEICEDVLGGDVMEENGLKYCVLRQGNFKTKIPLSAIRDQVR